MTSSDPIVTCKCIFLTKSHFGACYMSFHRFLWMPSWLRLSDLSFESPNDLQMTSKWPPNDLKWPMRTWKHNFLTKSHFGACNMSFYRFFWTPSWLRLSDLSFQSTTWTTICETTTTATMKTCRRITWSIFSSVKIYQDICNTYSIYKRILNKLCNFSSNHHKIEFLVKCYFSSFRIFPIFESYVCCITFVNLIKISAVSNAL